MAVAEAFAARWAVLRADWRLLVAVDLVVAVVLTGGGLVEVAHLRYSAPVVVGVTSCMACTAAVAVRRRAPFLVAVTATTAVVAYQISTNDPDGSFVAPALVLVFYSVGRSAAERTAWKRLVALLAYALAANIAIVAATGPFSLIGALGAWPIMLAGVAVGIVVAHHASLLQRLAAATATLRDEQRVRADWLLSEERSRVARELHDVVAHHVSVMVIQAGAARLVAAGDPPAAGAALRVVENCGREALTDLRRITGVMRRADPAGASMSAGLAHLDKVVDRCRASGVPVHVQVIGRLQDVPTAVDLVAYRIVQEALTNVVKHAGAAPTRVVIEVEPQALDVTITDEGEPSAQSTAPGSQHGLIGMRERVALYGGQLTSGHRSLGGFEVHARIPFRNEPIDQSERRSERPSSHNVNPHWVTTQRGAPLKLQADRLLAIVWLIALESDALLDQYRRGPIALNLVVVAVMGIAFAERRRAPLLFVLVVGVAAIPLSSGLTSPHSTLVGFYCVTVPMFTLARWETRARALTGLGLWIAGTIAIGIIAHHPDAGIAGGLVMSCLLWAAGRLWRRQQLLARRLADAQRRLAVEREDRERLAVASERARIARELHSLVAQQVVTMVVQATAAQGAIDCRPDIAITAATEIEQIGRTALGRMRDILGVLRTPQTLSTARPQPGLGQLHPLIAQLRANGRAIDLEIEGDPGTLPAAVDLTTYRIIEAAVNEADQKPSRPLAVAIRFGHAEVEVEITGTGLQLPSRLRLTVEQRASLCHGTVLAQTGPSR